MRVLMRQRITCCSVLIKTLQLILTSILTNCWCCSDTESIIKPQERNSWVENSTTALSFPVWPRQNTTVIIMWGDGRGAGGGSMQGQRIYHHLYWRAYMLKIGPRSWWWWRWGGRRRIREMQQRAAPPGLRLARAWQQCIVVGDRPGASDLPVLPAGAALQLGSQPVPHSPVNWTLNARQSWLLLRCVSTILPLCACVCLCSCLLTMWIKLTALCNSVLPLLLHQSASAEPPEFSSQASWSRCLIVRDHT